MSIAGNHGFTTDGLIITKFHNVLYLINVKYILYLFGSQPIIQGSHSPLHVCR